MLSFDILIRVCMTRKLNIVHFDENNSFASAAVKGFLISSVVTCSLSDELSEHEIKLNKIPKNNIIQKLNKNDNFQ